MPGLLDRLERLGNRIPDPLVLFALLASGVAVGSSVASRLGVTAIHPGTGELVGVVDLLTTGGMRRMFTEAVRNFTGFPPLGTVLAAMIGIGVAERAGLIGAALRGLVSSVPPRALTAALFFAGVNSSIAADAGFVVLVPLGAALYASVGRHPLAGLAVAYAAVSGGYGANLVVTALDPLLAGLSQAAAQIVDPGYRVGATANWWFNAASVLLLTVCGTSMAHRLEPRFGAWTAGGGRPAGGEAIASPPAERRGLRAAAGAGALMAVLIGLLVLPEHGVLRDASGGFSPFYDSIVILVSLCFLVPGIAYGRAAGTLGSSHDVAAMAAEALGTMGGYIVLTFAAAQFVAWFAWSNLGIVLAVKGASTIEGLHLGALTLLVVFVFVSAVLNLLIASASAKWAIMAPVFVPMGMLLGLAPELTQAGYRVGDAVTNILTPLLPYISIALTVARRYSPKAGLGTLLSAQVPYALLFGIAWTAMLVAWVWAGWPLGPESALFWSPPARP